MRLIFVKIDSNQQPNSAYSISFGEALVVPRFAQNDFPR